MLNRSRFASKKESKAEAVQSVAAESLADEDIHVGPSDYGAWQNDNKVCFLRMEGELFGGVPMNLELRLSPAAAVHRRRGAPHDRGLHRRTSRALTRPAVNERNVPFVYEWE